MTNLKKRKIKSALALSLTGLAAAIGILFLVFILYEVIKNGISSFHIELFTEDPAPPGIEGGGLRNAFVGQLLITLGAIIMGVPVGILGGTFLAEYGRNSKLASLISSLSDIMVSIPSIVVGTFVYAILVYPVGQFNGWAGSVALAIIMIPVVIRTTEDMLKLVPWSLREAAFALGAPYHKVILNVVYKSAASGILTGTLLAIARVAGETAPLLFTSFNNNFFSLNMNEPMASLTVTIFNYAMGPYDDWHSKAWAASFIITFTILLITIVSRIFVKRR
ncbi:MAG: phosphate ABC transporter permease PstA, partial [Calditrichaeota bacterium]